MLSEAGVTNKLKYGYFEMFCQQLYFFFFQIGKLACELRVLSVLTQSYNGRTNIRPDGLQKTQVRVEFSPNKNKIV